MTSKRPIHLTPPHRKLHVFAAKIRDSHQNLECCWQGVLHASVRLAGAVVRHTEGMLADQTGQ